MTSNSQNVPFNNRSLTKTGTTTNDELAAALKSLALTVTSQFKLVINAIESNHQQTNARLDALEERLLSNEEKLLSILKMGSNTVSSQSKVKVIGEHNFINRQISHAEYETFEENHLLPHILTLLKPNPDKKAIYLVSYIL
jgi:hypothetical protein